MSPVSLISHGLFTFFFYVPGLLYCIITASVCLLPYYVTMMGWLRISPSPSPNSSLNSRAASVPRPPRPKRGSSSIADSLTSFDFRRRQAHSEGDVDAIDLVSLEPVSPLRVSRSNSPSELPHSEEIILDHVTPPSSPHISIQEAPLTPSKTKNAIAFFERKVSGYLVIQLPTAEDPSKTSTARISPSPTYINAARAERQLRKSTSIAWPASVTMGSDSEDSMASLVSMLDNHNAPGEEQCSTPIHHEATRPPNSHTLPPNWLHSRSSIRSLEHKSESDGSLRALSPNVKAKRDHPADLQPITKTVLLSKFARSGHSRSSTGGSDSDLSEARTQSTGSLVHRPFSLSRRSQYRTSTEDDNTFVAALPCFLTSSDDVVNNRAVQGLHVDSGGPGLGASIDGSYSAAQSFSAPGEPETPSSTPLPVATEEAPIVTQPPSPTPLGTRLPRPLSSRGGLPLSRRSLSCTKAPATSAMSFFTSPPGMHINDMPPRNLVQIDETAPLSSPKQPPSAFPSPALPSPSYVDAMSFNWHEPRSSSPSSTGSYSWRHSIARLPVKMDSAAHFPRSVSPSWDMRHQSMAGIIVDPPLSPITTDMTFRTRTPVTMNLAAPYPRSATASPGGTFALVVDTPVSPLPLESSLSSRSSPATELEMPLYPMTIEPSFRRERSNPKFEPHSDLPPIVEVRQKSEAQTPQVEMPYLDYPVTESPDAETPEEERRLALGGDGHKSTPAIYDPPVSSPHMDDIALDYDDIPTKHGWKKKKERRRSRN